MHACGKKDGRLATVEQGLPHESAMEDVEVRGEKRAAATKEDPSPEGKGSVGGRFMCDHFGLDHGLNSHSGAGGGGRSTG